MKKWLVLALGFIVISAGLLFAKEATDQPYAFTLAISGGGATGSISPGVSFSLVGTAAGPSGFGIIEDSAAPFRTALGYNALRDNTTGQFNTAIGYYALANNVYGGDNTAVGYCVLEQNYTGNSNTAIGFIALTHNDDGAANTAAGHRALWSNVRGNRNTAIGNDALFWNTSGSFNTAIGSAALLHNTTGESNMASGINALGENTIGKENTACGNSALGEAIDGSSNTAFGFRAGVGCVGGYYNILIGAHYAYGIGEADDTNTIRIGSPYEPGHNPPAGQNRTFIAGIVETPLTAGDVPSVVGITSEGHLGTMSSDLLPQGPQGPVGPTGPPGPVGEGLISGSVLFLLPSATPPAGYAFLGTCNFSLTVAGSKKATKLTVNVYQKQ